MVVFVVVVALVVVVLFGFVVVVTFVVVVLLGFVVVVALVVVMVVIVVVVVVTGAFTMNTRFISFVESFSAVKTIVVFTVAAFFGVPESMPSSVNFNPSGNLLPVANWNCTGFKSTKFLRYSVKSSVIFF